MQYGHLKGILVLGRRLSIHTRYLWLCCKKNMISCVSAFVCCHLVSKIYCFWQSQTIPKVSILYSPVCNMDMGCPLLYTRQLMGHVLYGPWPWSLFHWCLNFELQPMFCKIRNHCYYESDKLGNLLSSKAAALE